MPADRTGERRQPMTAFASEARTLHVSSLHLAAVPAAVSVSRWFVRQVLHHWKLDAQVDDAALVMSELVSNAIKATGFQGRQPKLWEITAEHIIAIQLRVVDEALFIEVWDPSLLSPVKQTVTADDEGGRGLHLVEALAKDWGIYRPPAGGKIVWARVPLITPPHPPLDDSTLQLRAPVETEPPHGPVREQATTALLQRVLDGLRQLL